MRAILIAACLAGASPVQAETQAEACTLVQVVTLEEQGYEIPVVGILAVDRCGMEWINQLGPTFDRLTYATPHERLAHVVATLDVIKGKWATKAAQLRAQKMALGPKKPGPAQPAPLPPRPGAREYAI